MIGKIDISIRQSDLGQGDLCLESLRRRDRDPVIEPYASQLARGNAVHAAIEVCGNHMLQHDGEPTPIDIMERTLDALIETECDMVEDWRETRAKTESAIRANFEEFYWGIAPDLNPAAVEYPFRVLLDEDERRRIWLSGTIDWIDKSGRIIDWKNPSKPYKKWEKVRWDPQSTVYTYAVAHAADPDELGIPTLRQGSLTRDFELCMLVDGTAHWITIERGPSDWAALVDKCRGLADLSESDLKTWPQSWNSWYCSPTWCPNWNTCRGRHYADLLGEGVAPWEKK